MACAGVDAAAGEAEAASWPVPEPLNYRDVEVLAPMVRASTLALRLECLRYGADYVYGEEIIDRKIIGAARVVNKEFNTVDYVSPREKFSIFTTCAEERDKVFCQLGTGNGVLATQAALTVCKDVRGIDVNMGCPKSFSVKGGMGAALLEKPEAAADILRSLRNVLPSSCALTCKVRLLPTTAATRHFMQVCERSGAQAITVHVRTRRERPADPAHWDEMMRIWDAVQVPVLANGDFFNRNQIDEFWRHCRGTPVGQPPSASPAVSGPSGVMIARGALWNPSIFCRGDTKPPPFEEVVRGYVRSSIRANSTYQNTKWVLSQVLAGGTGVVAPAEFRGSLTKAFNRQTSGARSMAAICELLGMDFDAAAYPAKAHTTAYYRGHPDCPAYDGPDEAVQEDGAEAPEKQGRGRDAPDGQPQKRARRENGADAAVDEQP